MICDKVSIDLWILYCDILRSIKCLMAGMCVVPHMLAMIMRGGRTFHLCCISRGRSMAYLWSSHVVATYGNLSLRYVNSIVCILRCVIGLNMVLAPSGAPITHMISSRSLTGHVHHGR